MKKLVILMSLCGIFAACGDSGSVDVSPIDVPATGSRAKSISGYDSRYGNYAMSVSYGDDGRLDSIVIRNDAGEKTGSVSVTEADNSIAYIFTEEVVDMSREEIDALIAEYGPTGYREHLKTVTRTAKTITIEYWRGVVQSQTFTSYRPKGSTNGVFDSSYILDRRLRHIYEYDAQGRIAIYRKIDDVYDPEVSDAYYVRSITKTETIFDGGRIGGMKLYRSDGDGEAEGSYVPTDNYTFNYTSGMLTSVSGQSLQMSYTYTGALPGSITIDGQTVNYQYNAEGLVTRISYPNGEYSEITYEHGAGSLRLMSPLFDELFGIQAVQ